MYFILTLTLLSFLIKDIASSNSTTEECPKNEIYEECQSSSCRELPCNTPKPIGCSKDCISKCFCLLGYERNKEGVCEECPKTECPENEVWTECINPCDHYCNGTYYIRDPAICKECHGRGCVCEEKLRRDRYGRCVEC